MNNKKSVLELFQNRVVCPRCDGQGLVYKALVIPLNEYFYICDECDASWINIESISNKFIDFERRILDKGFTYNTIKLKDIDYYWYQKQEVKA